MNQNLLFFNLLQKSQIKTSNIIIKLNPFRLEPASFVKYLGTWIDEHSLRNTQTDFIIKDIFQASSIISKLHGFVPLRPF